MGCELKQWAAQWTGAAYELSKSLQYLPMGSSAYLLHLYTVGSFNINAEKSNGQRAASTYVFIMPVNNDYLVGVNTSWEGSLKMAPKQYHDKRLVFHVIKRI